MIDPVTRPIEDKKIAVFGLFENRASLEAAIDELQRIGFQPADISALLPDRGQTTDFAHEKHTKAPEGALAGAAAGGVVGGTLGLLLGIGALAIPGLGPFIAAGPIMAALAGAGAGAAVGGIAGALIGMGIPELEAKQYEGKIKNGNILLSVHAEDGKEVTRAKEILKNGGAEDISYTGEASVPNSARA